MISDVVGIGENGQIDIGRRGQRRIRLRHPAAAMPYSSAAELNSAVLAVSTSMVPSEMLLPESRMKEANDLLILVLGDVQPVAAGEGGRFGIGLEIVLELVDLFLGYLPLSMSGCWAATSFDFMLSSVSLTASIGGVGDVDLGGAEAEGFLDRRHGLVVRAHGRGDRPVGRIVGSLTDTQAGRDAVLRGAEILVGGGEGLERSHRAGVGS